MDTELFPTAPETTPVTATGPRQIAGRVYCAYKVYADINASCSKLCETVEGLVKEINNLIAPFDPKFTIEFRNESDEVIPCNADRTRFYIRVTENEK